MDNQVGENQADELRDRATIFRKQGNYLKAIDEYQILFKQYRGSCGKWEEWGYAYCLRKLGQAENAFEIIATCFENNPDFDQARNLYAWCLYDLKIRGFEEDSNEGQGSFLEAAEEIADISIPGDQYSPLVRAVFKVLDHLKERQNYPAEEVLSWLEKLDKDELKALPYKYTDSKGKARETASDKEKWYAFTTKALLELGKYDECIKVCDEAISAIETYHFGYDTWFKWRKAVSKARLGKNKEAIQEFEEILIEKREWFVQSEIARQYYELGEYEKALEYSIDAACNHGEIDKKLTHLLLMGNILHRLGRDEDGKKHLLLAKTLREEKGWKVPEELEGAIRNLRSYKGEVFPVAVLLKDLKELWKDEKRSYTPRMKGTIKTILSNGKAGFIAGDNGKDYYFRLGSFRGNNNRIQAGVKVEFSMEPSYDKKKNRESEQAVDINEI